MTISEICMVAIAFVLTLILLFGENLTGYTP